MLYCWCRKRGVHALRVLRVNITTGKCLEREGIDDKQVVQMGCGHNLLVAAGGNGDTYGYRSLAQQFRPVIYDWREYVCADDTKQRDKGQRRSKSRRYRNCHE